MPLSRRLLPALLTLLLAAPPLWADNLPELGDIAGDELPLATEKRIGQSIMNEIRLREPAYLDDLDVESYLGQLGGRLAAASGDPAFGFAFFAISDPSINAFAMPGGYVGVHTGLILAAQSESELAGVLAHEVSHVTQRHIARQVFQSKKISMASMAAMGLALLAARSNSQLAGAAVTGAQAGAVSAQLAYSRDFERESDRLGYDTLSRAGFDPRGMSAFFARLQQVNRLSESSATAYLRTHPLTGERLADMQNREQSERYRQVPDSLEFHLVRAKLRASEGPPPQAVREMQAVLAERKFALLPAAHYGLAMAHFRQRDWSAAQREIELARRSAPATPLIEHLRADIRLAAGDRPAGLAIYREAVTRFPMHEGLFFGYGAALVESGQFADALRLAESRLIERPEDTRLYRLKAASAAGMGRAALQHQALAEVFALQGQTQGAIHQLELAGKAPDADFYLASAIDARLRELKKRRLDELREKNSW